MMMDVMRVCRRGGVGCVKQRAGGGTVDVLVETFWLFVHESDEKNGDVASREDRIVAASSWKAAGAWDGRRTICAISKGNRRGICVARTSSLLQ